MFNRLFRRKSQQPANPTVNYGMLFHQVMAGLAIGWPENQVQTVLAGHENDQEFLQWLYRYDQDVLQKNTDSSVVERLIQ